MHNLVRKNFDRIVRWLFYLLVLAIPIENLPKRYFIPDFMRDVLFSVLWIAVILAILHYYLNKGEGETHSLPVLAKVYLIIAICWPILCTLIGAMTFPFWDESTNESLRNTKFVKSIAYFYPDIIQNDILLHLKFMNSMIIKTVKDLILPLIGIPFFMYEFFKNKSLSYFINTLINAAIIAACVLTLYSLIEIPWILTGNEHLAGALKFINLHLYDPENSHGWWPPLLWQGKQLRSFTYEPSFFGIFSMFLLPLIWYKALDKRSISVVVLVMIFTYMIYMTRARTAQIILLGELVLFILLSVWIKYQSWKRSITFIVVTVCISFGLYLITPFVGRVLNESTNRNFSILAEASQEAANYWGNDVASIASSSKRSNMARWGDTIALFKVGLNHPICGVGTNFHSPYVVKQIPAFAKNDKEINLWISLMNEKGFPQSGIPVLNQYAGIFAMYGVPGLVLFILPIFIIVFLFISHLKIFRGRKEIVFALIPLLGQIACMASNHFFFTYPISLAFAGITILKVLEIDKGKTHSI